MGEIPSKRCGDTGFGDVAVVQGAAVALDGKYLDPRSGERVVAPPPAAAGLSKADAGSYEQSKLLDCLPPASGARHGGEDDAARWLVETILANPGVALVPTGPMTNIAQVIPTPLHVLDLSPIFPRFFPVFCAFSPSR